MQHFLVRVEAGYLKAPATVDRQAGHLQYIKDHLAVEREAAVVRTEHGFQGQDSWVSSGTCKYSKANLYMNFYNSTKKRPTSL